VWKNVKFSLTQINFVKSTMYLVFSLVKPLLSQNVCEKSVRENFCNFHTVKTCLIFTKYSLKKHEMNYISNFTATLILREINFGCFQKVKSCRLITAAEMVKIAVLRLQNNQNWFHVKSEWQKNPEISTLWTERHAKTVSFEIENDRIISWKRS